jgi:phosphoglycerate dehydrogenase-like enzyme
MQHIIRNAIRPLVWGLLLPLLVGITAAPVLAEDSLAVEASPVVERLGLKEAAVALRESGDWTAPTKIVVRADAERIAWLQPAAPGVELVSATTLEQAIEAVSGAQGLIGFCSGEILAAGTGLRWVQLPYAGAESCVSLPVLRERDILVTNAQRVYGPEIAEHVLAMILALTRGLNRYIPAQQDGLWDRDLVPEDRLWELDMGMTVLATRNSSRAGPPFVSYVGFADELPQLTPRADVIVNAAPLTPATTGLFDKKFFAAMKPSAYFINVGRGGSVVTDDLVAALEERRLAGAGLDVTDPEPLPQDHPLWRMPGVIITPHVAAGSDLRSERLWIVMRENLRRYATGERMLSVVDIQRGY